MFSKAFVVGLLALGLVGCWEVKRGELSLSVDLYDGVPEIALLGEKEDELNRHRTLILDRKPASVPNELILMGIVNAYDYKNKGIRVFIKDGRVAMIVMRKPFAGKISPKEIDLFALSRPRERSWPEILEENFGKPIHQVTGGMVGATGHFYVWGDISFNGAGPFELALYRDYQIARFRRERFGKDVQPFKID